ncbi:MAG: FkbM family methyltransferase [Bauldia sp.]|nr:FkbM family methyltransferase [Bauldia sp.]
MLGFEKLTTLLSDVRRISGGEGTGLKIIPLEGDREIALGSYEPPVQRALIDNLAPGDVFYDIGANVGFFSLLAARRVGSGGQVYAFEPVPRNAAAIERGAQLNGFSGLKVFCKAAGATSGTAELNLAHHIGGAVLASVGTPPDRRGSLSVEVVAIDDIIRQRALRPPSLVKLDVEGAEMEVLEGMAATLRAHRPILIVELDDATNSGLEAKTASLMSLLAEAGYRFERLAQCYPDADWQVAHFVAKPT